MLVVGKAIEPPKRIKPQLTRNVDEAPAGDDWLHEIKYDGYRMHARLDRAFNRLYPACGAPRGRHRPEATPSVQARTLRARPQDRSAAR